MTELVATTPGLFPRLQEASDDESVQEGRREVLRMQREAGVDLPVEGQLGWRDLLAHPLTGADAVATGEPVPYYDTDATYREPVVTDDLSPTGVVADELAAAGEIVDGLAAVLPGPYTLADLATDDHYGGEDAFLDAIAEYLAGEVERFPAVDAVHLLEPSLVATPPGDGLDERASEAIDRVATATDATVTVQPYGGALEDKVYAHMFDARVDAIGFDLVSDPDGNAYVAGEYGTPNEVVLGVVDARDDRVESAETVRERVAWFRERTPVAAYDRIYAAANAGLFSLSPDALAGKLTALGEATAENE